MLFRSSSMSGPWRCSGRFLVHNGRPDAVRGKVTVGGFRMELIRIGCIEIDRRILEEPWRGPRRDS
jgi:hypothetical protein